MNKEKTAAEVKSLFLNVLLSRRLAGAIKAQQVARNMSRICSDEVSSRVLARFGTMTIREFNQSSLMLESKMLQS